MRTSVLAQGASVGAFGLATGLVLTEQPREKAAYWVLVAIYLMLHAIYLRQAND